MYWYCNCIILITLSMSRCDPDPPMFEAVLHNSTCIHNTEMYLLCILIYLSFRPEIQKYKLTLWFHGKNTNTMPIIITTYLQNYFKVVIRIQYSCTTASACTTVLMLLTRLHRLWNVVNTWAMALLYQTTNILFLFNG